MSLTRHGACLPHPHHLLTKPNANKQSKDKAIISHDFYWRWAANGRFHIDGVQARLGGCVHRYLWLVALTSKVLMLLFRRGTTSRGRASSSSLITSMTSERRCVGPANTCVLWSIGLRCRISFTAWCIDHKSLNEHHHCWHQHLQQRGLTPKKFCSY